jgi:predicted nucleotidyltransferase
MNGLLDVEWQPQGLVVLAPDPNGILVTDDIDVLSVERKPDGIGKRSQAKLDLGVASELRKARLLLHRVAEAIVLEKVLAGVPSEVDDAGQNDCLDQATESARATSSCHPSAYHWDCAP